MRYCPRCAAPLEIRPNGGRDRPHCLAEGCGYIFFGEFSIGCGGVVIRERATTGGPIKEALLVQRGQNPGKGAWQIPGGYVEVDEDVADAAERECWEEASIRARVVDVLGFRHSIGGQGAIGGPSTNVYVVFRLELLDGPDAQPRPDGDEIADARFVTLEEIETMERVQSLSRWSIQRALECGPGLAQAHRGSDINRPGWALFGLPLPEGVDQVPIQPPTPAVPAQPPESLPPAPQPASN